MASSFDLAPITRLLDATPIEALEEFARRYFTPSALARRRLAERNAAIRALAVGRQARYCDGAPRPTQQVAGRE